MNKIALFTGSLHSATGLLISVATNCPFVHAAIEVDGVWYHSSEKLGCFGPMDTAKFNDRRCIIYEFDGDLSEWPALMMGVKYDWQGVFGWLMHCIGLQRLSQGSPKAFYCFEAAINALYVARKKAMTDKRYTGRLDTALRNMANTDPEFARPVSGCDIDQMFTLGQSCRFGDYLDMSAALS